MCQAKGRVWDSEPISFQRGRCVYRESYLHPVMQVARSRWAVDNDIPIFSKDPSFVKKYLATLNVSEGEDSENP